MSQNSPEVKIYVTSSRGGSGKATIAHLKPADKEQPKPPTANRSGETIAITSGRGGSGKTTVSLLLGTTMAKKPLQATNGRDLKVCLVEFDEDNSLNHLLGQKTPNASQLEAIGEYTVDSINAHLVYNENFNMHVLLGTATDKSFYEAVIPVLRTMFDIIIFDTSFISNTAGNLTSEAALPLADKIVIVARSDAPGLNSLREVMNHHIPKYPVPHSIVFNGGNRSGKEHAWLMDQFREDVSGVIPLSTSVIHNAYSQGKLYDVIKDSQIGAIYQGIAEHTLAEENPEGK